MVAFALGAASERRHRGHLLTGFLQLASLGLGLVTFRLTASWFGTLEFCEYSLARRALSVVTFPLLLGLGTSLPRFAMIRRVGDGPVPSSYFLATLLIAAPMLLSALIVIGAFPGQFSNLVFGDVGYAPLSRPTLAAIVGLYLHMLAYSFLVGQYRTTSASLLQLINTAIAPGLAVILSGGEVARAMLWLGAISAGTSCVSILESSRTLGLRAAARGTWLPPIRELLAFGLPRVPGEFALFGLLALPAFVVAGRQGAEVAGFLSFGISLIQLIGSVFCAGAVILLSQAGRLRAEGRLDRLRTLVAWALGLSVSAALAVVTIVEVAFVPCVGWLLGPKMVEGASTARWLLPGAVPYVAYIILRGPLDLVACRPHGAVNLSIALGCEAAWLFAGGPPGLGLLIALAILGALMVASWRSALAEASRAVAGSLDRGPA